ncbi:putative HTH-type transcriptional regulator [compost metagenome]
MHGNELHVLFDDREVPEDIRVFMAERDYAAMAALESDLIGRPLPVIRAELRAPEPADIAPYLDVFGVMPIFDAPENRVIKDGTQLDLPLLAGDSEAARQCEEQCQALLAERKARSGLAGRIRHRLLARPGQVPDMEQVADELHMTSRTLRRRLADEGTSFRQLQDEVRLALAEELLALGSLTLEEIAERLGYGEVSNFIHAFKRWTGTTPRQYGMR